jgi:hypothetical protein
MSLNIDKVAEIESRLTNKFMIAISAELPSSEAVTAAMLALSNIIAIIAHTICKEHSTDIIATSISRALKHMAELKEAVENERSK